MDLSIYENLPDYLSADDIKSHFNELLRFAELNYEASPLAISEALYELAERQCNTFEYIEESLKNRVDN